MKNEIRNCNLREVGCSTNDQSDQPNSAWSRFYSVKCYLSVFIKYNALGMHF